MVYAVFDDLGLNSKSQGHDIIAWGILQYRIHNQREVHRTDGWKEVKEVARNPFEE